MQAGLWGYINREGDIVIPPRYASARDFHEGLAEVEMERLWGYIDTEGRTVIQPSFRRTGEFVEGIAAASPRGHPDGFYGFINRHGEYAIFPQFGGVGRFRHRRCFVELVDEVAYIDPEGSVTWRGPYVDVGQISEL